MSDNTQVSVLENIAFNNIKNRFIKDLNESRICDIHKVFSKYGLSGSQYHRLLATITLRDYSEYSSIPNLIIPEDFFKEVSVVENFMRFFLKEIQEIKEKTEFLENYNQ